MNLDCVQKDKLLLTRNFIEMLRKENLCVQEEESYHRLINKENVEIRRNEREAIFKRKRNNFADNNCLQLQQNYLSKNEEKEYKLQLAQSIDEPNKIQIFILDQRYSDQILQANKCEFPKQITAFIHLINSESTLSVICGMIGLRRLLLADMAIIQKVIDNGLVKTLIELMNYKGSKQVQLEATRCVSNITAGTTLQCKTLIDGGAVPILVKIVNQNHLGIVEQAIWALGNLCVDSSQFRNILLEAGVGQAISKLVMEGDVTDQLQIECCWSLASLCRGEPLPEFQKIKNPLRIICLMVSLGCIKCTEVFIDCCWAISYHYTGRNNRGKDVLDFNLLQRIVPIGLQNQSSKVIIPIIRIIGQLSQGNSHYMDHIINKGCLDLLQKCIQHKDKVVRREAAFILSNLTASNQLDHIQSILRRDTIMIKMMEMFVRDVEEVRKEIAFFFSNMCYGGKTLQLQKVFADLKITACYVELLKSKDSKVIKKTLESLNQILRFAENKKAKDQVNKLAKQLLFNGGIEILEELQFSKDDCIYFQVHQILMNYYEVQDPLDRNIFNQENIQTHIAEVVVHQGGV